MQNTPLDNEKEFDQPILVPEVVEGDDGQPPLDPEDPDGDHPLIW